ncbi:MAG: radical SAM protein [Candidatus Woesearchaeota archaeon]|nr:radical SAM protein [Candidatus Woesearchaeota archaeon]
MFSIFTSNKSKGPGKQESSKYKHSTDYNVIKHLNSWTSINPSYGCVWDCAYCVQEKDNWYVRNGIVKEFSPKRTLDAIVNDKFISKGQQPLALFNFSDPFLPQNREDLVEILQGLDKMKYHNIVGLITKTLPDKSTLKAVKNLKNLKPVVIVSYANLMPKDVERASKEKRVELIKMSSKIGIPTLVYMRPLVKEWISEKSIEEFADNVTPYADGIVISGLIYTDEIKQKLAKRRVPLPDMSPNGEKHLDYGTLETAKRVILSVKKDMPIFTSTSCGVSYVYGIPCYNGYGALRARESGKGCCKHTCYEKQRDVCMDSYKLSGRAFKHMMEHLSIEHIDFDIRKGYVDLYGDVSWLNQLYLRHNTSHWMFNNQHKKTLFEKVVSKIRD